MVRLNRDLYAKNVDGFIDTLRNKHDHITCLMQSSGEGGYKFTLKCQMSVMQAAIEAAEKQSALIVKHDEAKGIDVDTSDSAIELLANGIARRSREEMLDVILKLQRERNELKNES